MKASACHWGILSTATIARKIWKAIRNSGNSTLVAVASRTEQQAQQFVQQWQAEAPFPVAPQAVGGYEALLARPDIDAVYIPLPTGLRTEWVLRAAAAGKHVLCEKPCGTTGADVEQMVQACRQQGVIFMDGVMFMHSHRLALMRQVLDDGQSVGRIRRIVVQFSFFAPRQWLDTNIRLSSALEPHGCLGDLGWYCIRFALWANNWKLPERAAGRLLAAHHRADSPHAVPIEFSGELFFADDVTASFYCSFITHHQQWAVVSGSEGYLHVPDFVLPYLSSELRFGVTQADFVLHGCDFNMEHRQRQYGVTEYSNSFANAQEANMIRHFADLVLSGRREPIWEEVALKTQAVMDACYASSRNGEAPVRPSR